MSRGAQIKEVEEFPKRIKIFLIVILVVFSIGTIGFKILDNSSLADGFIRTLETTAFMFSDDSHLVERLLEVFLATIGLFTIWWVLWSVADMTLDGNLRRYLKMKYYSLKMRSMKNHIIIAGGGRIGEEIARVISVKKSNFVIIDNNELIVKSLRKKGYNAIYGNAEEESALKEAKIESALKIILTLPKTEANILVTLTVKELNPKIEVYARADDSSLASKLKKVGVKAVVIPEIVAGDKLAEELKV